MIEFNFSIFVRRHVALQRGDVILLWIYVLNQNSLSVSILRNAICAKLHCCSTIHNLSRYSEISLSTEFMLLSSSFEFRLDTLNLCFLSDRTQGTSKKYYRIHEEFIRVLKCISGLWKLSGEKNSKNVLMTTSEEKFVTIIGYRVISSISLRQLLL